ncbi:hypothetical protein EYF80_025054 [Liparis tanakae]|uniref:Uncharacterized protein n=1 Tax=Liparis tanakae TaxID=230148 RepID=A0A4Z2HFV2_9TELE|nr:hypothetical protein EYF80_025054 [Liparis tanakae]
MDWSTRKVVDFMEHRGPGIRGGDAWELAGGCRSTVGREAAQTPAHGLLLPRARSPTDTLHLLEEKRIPRQPRRLRMNSLLNVRNIRHLERFGASKPGAEWFSQESF